MSNNEMYLREQITLLTRTLEAERRCNESLRVEIQELKEKWIQQDHEIRQILGQALGYPWYKDDTKNFPDATAADGVCVGEHTTLSLVDEVAAKMQR